MKAPLLFCLSLLGYSLQGTVPNRFITDQSGNQGVGLNNLYKGEGNRWMGDRNVMMGKDNAIQGTDNKVIGGTNVIKGQINVISGESNTIQGEQNTIKGANNLVLGSGNVVTNDISAFDFESQFSSRFPSWMKQNLNTQPIQQAKKEPINWTSTVTSPSISSTSSNSRTRTSQPSWSSSSNEYKPNPTRYQHETINYNSVNNQRKFQIPVAIPSNRNDDLRSQIQNQVQQRLREAFTKAGIYRN